MPEKELIPLLCKTWKINYDKADGKITRQFPKLERYSPIFKPDFTFIVDMNGTQTTGYWCYEIENQCVSLALRGESENQIAMVDELQLIMIMRKDAKKVGKLTDRNHGQYIPR